MKKRGANKLNRKWWDWGKLNPGLFILDGGPYSGQWNFFCHNQIAQNYFHQGRIGDEVIPDQLDLTIETNNDDVVLKLPHVFRAITIQDNQEQLPSDPSVVKQNLWVQRPDSPLDYYAAYLAGYNENEIHTRFTVINDETWITGAEAGTTPASKVIKKWSFDLQGLQKCHYEGKTDSLADVGAGRILTMIMSDTVLDDNLSYKIYWRFYYYDS